MDDSNQQTLGAYEAHVQAYIDGTPQTVDGHVKTWIDESLGYLPAGASVLELGSAFGRDADYIEAAGYAIQRTDATKAFVDLLQERGHQARLLNALTDPWGGPYDMVFADAVLLHFTVEQFNLALTKARASLQPQGILAFTVKQGEGSEWSDAKLGAPRFFQYWQAPALRQALETAGFTVLKLEADLSNKWWQVIARPAAQSISAGDAAEQDTAKNGFPLERE